MGCPSGIGKTATIIKDYEDSEPYKVESIDGSWDCGHWLKEEDVRKASELLAPEIMEEEEDEDIEVLSGALLGPVFKWGSIVQGVELGDGTLDIGKGILLKMTEN